MNRDLFLLTYVMQENVNQMQQMPEWAKAERLGYCEQLSRRSLAPQKKHVVSRHVKRAVADSLRKAANKLDPVQFAS